MTEAVMGEEAVRSWLREHSWFPGRDIGAEADRLISVRIRDFADQGEVLAPLPCATNFVREYGNLELPYPRSSDIKLVVTPTFGYDGDAEDILELSESLGRPIFPVAYETRELGIMLMDDSERVFYLHETGCYFVAERPMEAFAKRLEGSRLQDAEDFFV
ncbi:SUKH-3 domain-containing protein [Streptomyces caniferus]|uniref:SUKH-3 domain-containing protein n=1 Tax=Streptomyces caniferus TaxID=285557 RepID=UPI002E2AD1CB|nr:SUKH-3 domain-containing protein [Streptomyces caniferus]